MRTGQRGHGRHCAGAGERPPTAGLAPRFADLFARGEEGAFAKAIAGRCGVSDAVLLSSGTSCLLLIFEHLKSRSARRSVIIPAYTCPLVVLAAAQAGLKVVACDMARERFDLDLDQLARLVGPDTLCVVPTHYGGWLTDVEAVRRVVRGREPDAVIIEDAAQAFGARWAGRPVGLVGDVAIFSFAAGKGLTTFEGGAIVSRDPGTMAAIGETARGLVRPAPVQELSHTVQLAGYHLLYNPMGLRLIFGAPKRRALARGDEIEAASDHFEGPIRIAPMSLWRQRVGLHALPRLDAHLAGARATFDSLADRLAGCRGLKVHVPEPDADPAATFLMVTLPADVDLAPVAEIWRSRAGVAKLFTRAIGDYPYLAGHVEPGETPNARDLARRTITISTSAIGSGAGGGQGLETVLQAIRDLARADVS